MVISDQGRLSRRRLLAVAAASLAAMTATVRASLAETTSDLAVTCDAAAAPAVLTAAKAYRTKTGVRVRVFPTAPGLVLPQIERDIQNDILICQIATLDQAEKQGLLAQGGRAGPWRNRLVTAAAKQPAGAEGSFAVPDPSPASDIDGPAIFLRLGPPQARLIGVLDTGAVAWTLINGGARQGLLHQTEIAADDRLRAIAPVPDDAWPPILYQAAVRKLASRGDPGAFLAFLASQEGQAVLQAAGLEAPA